jgi:hypothetical protein
MLHPNADPSEIS